LEDTCDSNASVANSPLLAGKQILITRAAHQASSLADRLKALGALTISIPTIEIVPPASSTALDEALGRLASFDVVAFTSANAVRAFSQRAGELGMSPVPRRIAVVGPATARAVEALGLPVDTMPTVFTAEALAQTLLPEAHGSRILLVLAEAAPRILETTLTAAGAAIHVAAAYANRIPGDSLAAIKDLFKNVATLPDAVTFTSASTAAHLVALLDAADLTLPAPIARISIGPVTSLALEKLRLPAHIEAREPTLDALVAAVVKQLAACP
jgi:uroporphyrinogen-III synthase